MGGDEGNHLAVGGTKFRSISAASRHYCLDPNVIKQRIANGWEIDVAFGLREKEDWGGPRKIEVDGVTYLSVAAAANVCGLLPANCVFRLSAGWSVNQAFEIDPPPARPSIGGNSIVVEGVEFSSIKKAAKHYGANYPRVRERIQYGWTPEEALELVDRREIFVVEGREFRSPTEAAEFYEINRATAQGRIGLGWTIEQALGVVAPSETERGGISVEVQGETFISVSHAARHHGLSPSLVIKRMGAGWSLMQALGLEAAPGYPNARKVVVEGVAYPSRRAACLRYGRDPAVVANRLSRGLSLEQALGIEPCEGDILLAGRSFKNMGEVARHYGITKETLHGRLHLGWTIEEIVGIIPRSAIDTKPKELTLNGVKYRSRREASQALGVSDALVSKRLSKGWTEEGAYGLVPPPGMVTLGGMSFRSYEAAGRHFGLSGGLIRRRLSMGRSSDEAVGLIGRTTQPQKRVNRKSA
jgi:hypothetical protein